MKYLAILFLIITNISYAQLNVFDNKSTIKSNDINQNFIYFKNFIESDYQKAVSGKIITKSIFDNFLSSLGCSSGFNGFSDKIQSTEINNYFSGINCIFPQNKFYNSTCDCYQGIPYKNNNDQLTWVIDGSLNTGIGSRKMDVYLPNLNVRNGKVIFYFHPLTEKKELESSLSQNLKNNFINQGYVFISVEFRHPAVEGYNNIDDQFDISEALNHLKENIDFGNYDKDNISAIAYSKGSLVLANLLDERYSNYSDLNFKKIYLLDAQITYNEDTYYNLYVDKNNILYNGFINVSSKIAFDSLNEGAKSFVGLQLINDINAVDAYRSLFDSVNMISKTNLPEIKFGYNLKRNGDIYVNSILTSIIPININPGNLDYLLHNPTSIDIFCNEYMKYGICSGTDNLSYSLSNIMADINSFID